MVHIIFISHGGSMGWFRHDCVSVLACVSFSFFSRYSRTASKKLDEIALNGLLHIDLVNLILMIPLKSKQGVLAAIIKLFLLLLQLLVFPSSCF